MPTLTLKPADGCLTCGCRVRGFKIGTFRINKGSIRSTGTVLGFVEPTCCECGQPHADVSRWQLDPESQAKVTAHRARMGWTYSPVGNGS